MSSACLRALVLSAALLLPPVNSDAGELRVCADPNNMPFSNERGEGFENRIVEIVARELGAQLSYTWWAQRRGFIADALNAGLCDVCAGHFRHNRHASDLSALLPIDLCLSVEGG